MGKGIPIMDRRTIGMLVVFGGLAFLLFSRKASEEKAWQFRGRAMGTFYGIQVVGRPASDREIEDVKRDVHLLLARISDWMSAFDPESEISRFNASRKTEPFKVSGDFAHVAGLALEVAEKSGGAFDPTVAPLVDLWGFGKKEGDRQIPAEADIEQAKARTGFKHLSVPSQDSLRKDTAELELDLSAIAKGYGVDRVAQYLLRRGYGNVLVDIGGEIVAKGNNMRDIPWRISVEAPKRDAGYGRDRYRVLSLDNAAVATSGDYRNYFKRDDKAYSHIIDPRTGWPVSNNVASVTVIAADCMTADALATALMVLGPEEGIELLKEYRGVEAMLIVRNDDGTFRDVTSRGFSRYVVEDDTR